MSKPVPFERSFASFEDKRKLACWSDKNELKPEQVYKSSNKKYWFKCDKCEHNFEKNIFDIIKRSGWCPYCATPSKILCNNLNCNFCFQKSFFSIKNKYILSCWSNKNLKCPRDVFKSSNQKFWFNCKKCNHSFSIQLSNITILNRWCSYCSIPTKKLCDDVNCDFCFNNSFASFVDKQKLACWSNKNKKLPNQIIKNSNKKFYFMCNICNHTFKSSLNDINSGSWCNYCGLKQLCDDKNCNLCFQRSFLSCDKAKYWSDKNLPLLPRQIFKSTAGQYWFKCNTCYNEFKKSLYSIKAGRWCPFCKNKTEKKLYKWLTANYQNVSFQPKFDWCINEKTNQKLPFDYAINYNIIIELDGGQHFRQISNWQSPEKTHNRDIFKLKSALTNNYHVIRIYQEDVFADTNDWQTELATAISSLLTEQTPQIRYISSTACYNDFYEENDENEDESANEELSDNPFANELRELDNLD